MRLRNDETADALGAGVVPVPGSEETAYRRMADLAAAEAQPVALPTFGVPLDTPYTTFTQPLIFPVRADNGALYLARLGHGGFGWRQSPDTLLALYRLQDDHLVPAAAVYVAARRDGIAGIAVK
jgi:hypothetical protein